MARSRAVVVLSALALTDLALVGCYGDESQEEVTTAPTADEATAPPLEPIDVAATDSGDFAAELTDLTNEARENEGLEPLELDACATRYALERAEAQRGAERLTHAPMTEVNQDCEVAVGGAASGENLSGDAYTAHSIVQAWLASASHRANLLNPEFTRIGVGCVTDETFGPADSDHGPVLLCSQVYLGPPAP